MTESEKLFGRTPNGGDYSIVFYVDEDGNSVEPDNATKIIIQEYTSDDNLIQETIALTNNR